MFDLTCLPIDLLPNQFVDADTTVLIVDADLNPHTLPVVKLEHTPDGRPCIGCIRVGVRGDGAHLLHFRNNADIWVRPGSVAIPLAFMAA